MDISGLSVLFGWAFFFIPMLSLACLLLNSERQPSHTAQPQMQGGGHYVVSVSSLGSIPFEAFSIFIIALLVLRAVALVVMKSLLDARSSPAPPMRFYYDYY